MKSIITLVLAALIISGCSNSEIDQVKNGHLNYDNSISVGDALDNYKLFSSTEWSFLETTQKRKVVQFNGLLKKSYVDKFFKSSSDRYKEEYLDQKKGVGPISYQEFKKKWEAANENFELIKNIIFETQFVLNADGTFQVKYIGFKIEGHNENFIDKSADVDVIGKIYLNDDIPLYDVLPTPLYGIINFKKLG